MKSSVGITLKLATYINTMLSCSAFTGKLILKSKVCIIIWRLLIIPQSSLRSPPTIKLITTFELKAATEKDNAIVFKDCITVAAV